MRKTAATLTAICLVSVVAAAQPAPDGPAGAPEPPATDPPEDGVNPPPTDQPLIDEERAVRPPEKKPNAGFDKAFFLRSDDEKYLLEITGRFQPYYVLTRESGPADYRNRLEVRRARVVLEGNLHGKNLQYKLQTDFGRGNVTVRDAHFDVKLASEVWLRFGQWKRPFSRQHITSSGRQELTDRSITDDAFDAGRDVGIAIRNDYESSPEFEWTIGVFNGRGERPVLGGTVTVDPMTGMGMLGPTTSTNVPMKFRPAVIGRAGINRNKLKGYSEADLEGGSLRWGAALSVWLEGDFDDDDESNQKVQADYIVKANGFSTTGGVYAMTDQEAVADTSITDAETSLIGFHLQAGYMLNKHWQAAARYGLVNDPRTKSVTTRDQQEICIAANFFGVGHDAKFQGGMRLVKTGDASFTDTMIFELGANVGW